MWVSLLVMVATAPGFADDKPLNPEQAEALVLATLKKFGVGQAPLRRFENEDTKAVLTGWHVFVLRYPQFPVARVPPEPLRSNNLFFVSPQGTVELVNEPAALHKFFQKVVRADSEKAAAAALRAWLGLGSELRQDGFYQFRLANESVAVKKTDMGLLARGRIEVVPKAGNEGFLAAELLFSPRGELLEAREDVQLKAGIRPICQASKLLDPDPVVRRMAERDLLILGPLALPYLEEQRQGADPNLRQAIERIRQRIERGER